MSLLHELNLFSSLKALFCCSLQYQGCVSVNPLGNGEPCGLNAMISIPWPMAMASSWPWENTRRS